MVQHFVILSLIPRVSIEPGSPPSFELYSLYLCPTPWLLPGPLHLVGWTRSTPGLLLVAAQSSSTSTRSGLGSVIDEAG